MKVFAVVPVNTGEESAKGKRIIIRTQAGKQQSCTYLVVGEEVPLHTLLGSIPREVIEEAKALLDEDEGVLFYECEGDYKGIPLALDAVYSILDHSLYDNPEALMAIEREIDRVTEHLCCKLEGRHLPIERTRDLSAFLSRILPRKRTRESRHGKRSQPTADASPLPA